MELNNEKSTSAYKNIRLLGWILFLVGVGTAIYLAQLKIHAVQYHEKNYGFYAQFAAKLLDPDLSNQYTLQPEGHNLFGLVGVEGEYSFHQSIHLEPAKYFFALIYLVFQNPIAIFAFIALVFYSPVVYFTHIHKIGSRTDLVFVVLMAVLLAFYPSNTQSVAHDLRPRSMMAAVLALSFLAIHYQRPTWEKVILFGFLFLIREEAVVFGVALLPYNFFRTASDKDRKVSSLLMLATWATASLVIFLYFDWTSYQVDNVYNPLSVISRNSLLLGIILLVGTAALIAFRKTWTRYPNEKVKTLVLQFLSFGVLLFPLSLQLKSEIGKWEEGIGELLLNLLRRSTINLFAIVLLLLIILVWGALSENGRRRFNIGLALASAAIIVFHFVFLSEQINRYKQDALLAEILFELEDATDYRDTTILADYATFQVYYRYENLYIYNRLPSQIVAERAERYYPENLAVLASILTDSVSYIVLERESSADILPILTAQDIQILAVTENESFQIFQIK